MSFTHTLTQSYATNAGTVASSTLSFTGDSEDDLDVAVPAGASNQFYAIWFNKAALASLLITCDQAVTIRTNQAAQIAAPAAPSLTAQAGGSLAAGTVYAKDTYVNAQGETTGSTEASVAVTAGQEVVITSPPASGDATGWKPYASTTAGGEQVQNGGAAIAIGTNYTMTSVAAGGAAPPASNTTGPQDTIALSANVPLIWNASSAAANPFAGNVTGIYVTNPATVAANLKIRALENL